MARNTNTEVFPLADLLLDAQNPRLGRTGSPDLSQKDLVSKMVTDHGISDLLSSMAVHGYFDAEPLVGVKGEEGKVTIVDGNRRLAAALLLTHDPRADDYQDIAASFRQRGEPERIESLGQLPVTLFEERDLNLVLYVGIRHLKVIKAWDFYTKAHWIFQLLATSSEPELRICDAARLIGEAHSATVRRILEGYILMSQLEADGYQWSDSQRNGKSSSTAFPYVLIFSALRYDNIRIWLDIQWLDAEQNISAATTIVGSEEGLKNARKLMTFLLGSKSEEKMPIIKDRSQISSLNNVIDNPQSVEELEAGIPLAEVEDQLRPARKRLYELILHTHQSLKKAHDIVSSEDIESMRELEEIRVLTGNIAKLTENISKQRIL